MNVGKLILVPTPIGNLGDISERAILSLEEADFIAAEDTRVSLRLLNHLGIHKPLVSYHEHNKKSSGEAILRRLQAGETCALVTDAGTPGISDPGEDLVQLCAQYSIPVTAIPGPCALVTALAVSGLPTRRFCFEGFLPTDNTERAAAANRLSHESRTIILYEAPHRLADTLEWLCSVLGENRKIALCRELTKIHEEITRTTLGSAAVSAKENGGRGEYVLIIEGVVSEKTVIDTDKALQMVEDLIAGGSSRRDAIREVSEKAGIPKNLLYRTALSTSSTQEQ